MKEKKENALGRLLEFAGGHRKLTLLGCVLSGVSAVLTLLPFVCVWFVVRQALGGINGEVDPQALAHWGFMALWFALGGLAVYFAALMCTHLAAFRTARNMRVRAAERLVELPLGFFTVNQSGRLRKLIDDNAEMTESLLAHQLPDLAGAIVTPVAAVALLFVFDWRMGLLCLLPMVVAVLLMGAMMGGKNARFFEKYQRAIEELSGEATEYVRGIPVVKVFQQTVYSFKSLYQSIMSYKELASDYAMGCRNPMTGFTTALNATFLLLIPVGMLVIAGSADSWGALADFIFYILFYPMCALMMMRVMYASEAMMQADEAVQQLDRILKEAPLPEPEHPVKPGDASIAFEEVSFTYPGAAKKALDQVSFQVPQGATVALVGPSGGGKTTAASLIPRFWDVTGGRVKVGGVDVRSISSRALMDQVAFVFQDTRLFKESLLENIRAARPQATREQAVAAAMAAQCGDILEKLPQGIDTVVGTKGVYLSGGECQRIALARAILKDAPIVLLDEATAFADPENESLIQKAFEQLTRGKTVLMIAHRLSTVRHADEILVMQEGRIAERGTHRALLERKGIYGAMWEDYLSSAQWKMGKEESV
ncbi:MAG TPA: ABC transporter ATP-binding protein [Candidatus Egerieimonas intestinavium]|uniref:ABC transporter ATP-binding protein n=1 Tax=Candidatus Egerieimonas intestinavium TaxID=2840777 RepID=A0A9D1EI65_9FIRM|nr:ABC transporter ATP-binding protein [Candidatus Egerieimonas intestinavium]